MFLFILVKRKYGKPLAFLEAVFQSSPVRRFLSAHNCYVESCGDDKGHRSINQDIIYASTNTSLCKKYFSFFPLLLPYLSFRTVKSSFSLDLCHLFEYLISSNCCYYHMNLLLWVHSVLCFQNMLHTILYIHIFLHSPNKYVLELGIYQ